MRTQIMVIRDIKIGAYMQPFTAPSVNAAIRSFIDACAPGGTSDVSKHPTDFEMFRIGEYEDSTGKIEPLENPEFVVKGERHV